MSRIDDNHTRPDTGPASPPQIEIDGALVARSLGLEVARFRELMAQRKIAVLCERGTGDDAGLYRATFYYGSKRLRLVVDEQGQIAG
ncbi:MAG: DUF6522 family protein [Xanthomonadales bacterium]|nr:DUF6522 family protein [Xanthomonadales bacterium]